MFQTKLLQSQKDKTAFCDQYTLMSGTSLLLSEIQSCRIFEVRRGEKTVGGFVVRHQGMKRAIRAIKDFETLKKLNLQTQSSIEITGLWLLQSERSIFGRLFFILAMMDEAIRFGEGKIVGITTKEKLWSTTYAPMGAKVLFRGPCEIVKGSSKSGVVFEFSVLRMIPRIPIYFFTKYVNSLLNNVNKKGVLNENNQQVFTVNSRRTS